MSDHIIGWRVYGPQGWTDYITPVEAPTREEARALARLRCPYYDTRRKVEIIVRRCK